MIIVIHEIFGMRDWVEDVAHQFAAAGFIAFAPDLLSGMPPNGGRTEDFPAGTIGPAIEKLDPNQITADLNAVADYSLKLPAAQKKIYVTDFCWTADRAFGCNCAAEPVCGSGVLRTGSCPTRNRT